MADFKIRRGPSTVLFAAPGVVNPKVLIEDGCWYLCTDTTDLFVGAVAADGTASLKQINAESFAMALEEVKAAVDELRNSSLYQKINDESELPTDFTADTFNPNVTYYIVKDTTNNVASTFIFDVSSNSYICTNGVSLELVQNVVSEAIDASISNKLKQLVPAAVQETLRISVLDGGDAYG